MDTVQWDLLKLALFWLVGGGGAGTAAFFVLERVPSLAKIQAEAKRWIGLGLAALLAMGGYALSVGLAYLPPPMSVQGWLESLFAVGGMAAGIGQLIHGRAKARALARSARGDV